MPEKQMQILHHVQDDSIFGIAKIEGYLQHPSVYAGSGRFGGFDANGNFGAICHWRPRR
jgi:hypothetical protein